MNKPKTNICLNMIVKNEEQVLPRLLASVKDYIDYYVIVDTGSTDGTIALIKSEMEKYGIAGEVHERPWVNFGVNRQQALELAVAADQAEWVLIIDADEELRVSDERFFEKLESGVNYHIEKHQNGTNYGVPGLLNIRSSKHEWRGPVHNYVETLEGSKNRPLRKDLWIIYHEGQGAKSHGVTKEEKFLRDARLLEEELEKNPDCARSQFYLGQSYRDAGHPEKAIEAYRKRVGMGGWEEEQFIAQLEVGRISIKLERPEDVVLSELLSAYNLRPRRAEPLFELAFYFRGKKQYPMAALFAKAGAKTPMPSDILFVVQNVYSWRLIDEVAVACFWIGDYVTAKSSCEEILQRVEQGLSVPEHEKSRILKNLHAANERLGLT